MNDKKQRIEWIDMAKGYGILLVLIGHCDMPNLNIVIYSFHIPLFFFLSGYVYKTTPDFVTFTLRKIKKLFLPYWGLCIPMIFFELIFGEKNTLDLHGLISETYAFLLQERHTTLWFLATLFLLNFIMYPFANKKTQIIVPFVILSSYGGLLLWNQGIKSLPWNFDAALVALPFFFVGYTVKKQLGTSFYLQLPKRDVFITSAILFMLTIIMAYWNYCFSGSKVNIFYSTYDIEWLSYVVAFMGIASCILFSMVYTNKIICYIGKNSLIYFAWHQSIVMPLLSYLYWKTDIYSLRIYQETTIFKWITIFLVVIILYILNELIANSKIKFILGK